ncbi:hypothetical protein JI57_01395 [Psychromonas sp. PRT-SC03]|nr:hypothetical protein JI57_01395 [Psychromonas sp. PRT-SC03]
MKQYIQLRNNTYHFRFKIPEHLRGIINKKEITRSLKTDIYQHACITVLSKLFIIHQIKQATKLDSNIVNDLFKELLDFSLSSKTSSYVQLSSNVKLDDPVINPVTETHETTQYLLSKAWSDFKDYKSWSEKGIKEYTHHYDFLLALWCDVDVLTITKQCIKQSLKAFELMPKGNLKPFNKLTVAERVAYPTDDILESDFISPKTVKGLLKTLQSFFSTFLTNEMDYFSVSPTANVKYIINDVRYGVYTDKEINLFEKEANRTPQKWKKWVLLLAIYTGARRGEIVKFLRDGTKYDQVEKIYYFELLEGKTAAARRKIPVHPKLIEYGVLTIPQMGITGKAVTDYLNIIRESLDIPITDNEGAKRVFHSFRHTFITKGVSKGVTVEHLKALVGHSNNIGVTSRYIHGLSLLDINEVMLKISY